MGKQKSVLEKSLLHDTAALYSLSVDQLHDLKQEITDNLERDGFKDFTVKYENGYILVQLPSIQLRLLPKRAVKPLALAMGM